MSARPLRHTHARTQGVGTTVTRQPDPTKAEARRRLTEVLLRHRTRDNGGCTCNTPDLDPWAPAELATHIANQILDQVFPVAFWIPQWAGPGTPDRALALRSNPEPADNPNQPTR